MRLNARTTLLVSLFMILGSVATLVARDNDKSSSATFQRSSTLVTDAYINANNIFSYTTNIGVFARDYVGELNLDGGGGLVFPYSSMLEISNGTANKTAVFAAGIWFGATDSASGDTLVTLAEYSSEFTPGNMLANGSPGPNGAAQRVYKLYRDSLAGNPNQDYLNWPTDQGAPTLPGGIPLILGDQTLWTVYNDAEASAHQNDAGGTAPLGIEVQQLLWADDTPTGTDTSYLYPDIVVTHNLGSINPAVSVFVKNPEELTGDDYSVVFEVDPTLGLVWKLVNLTTAEVVLDDQTNFLGTSSSPVADGLQVRVTLFMPGGQSWEYSSANPLNVSPVATADNGYTGGARWFTGGDHGGELLFGGVFQEPNFWGKTTLSLDDYRTVEIRFRPMVSYTDLNGDGSYTIGEPYQVDDTTKTQKAFMYQSFGGFAYEGFFVVPFTVWDVSGPQAPRQLNVVVRDRDANFQWDLHNNSFDAALPNNGDQQFNYTWILGTSYDSTGQMYGDGSGGSLDFFAGTGGANYDAMWAMWLDERGTTRGPLAEECILTLVPSAAVSPADTFYFTAPDSVDYILGGGDVNAFYVQYTLINKASRTLKDFYIGIWADPDLGGAVDDLVGCDPEDNLFFCYNATNSDNVYGAQPPAVGFKIVEGPLVDSPGDTAYVGGAPVFDKRNLELTSFAMYINGTDPTGPDETYYYLNGLDKNGLPFIDPTTSLPSEFYASGDPVAGTGWNDSNPSDRRMSGNLGPFTMSPGDTQFVTIKFGAALGVDRLNSIKELREVLNAPSDIPTAVAESDDPVLPQGYALEQNHPNPFNPATTIHYSLPRRSAVRLDVFNILGQRVATLVDGDVSAGEHTVRWDGSNVASGVYLYRLRAGETTLARKMVLLK